MALTLGELYRQVVEIGKAADPRSKSEVSRFLKSRQEAYKKITSRAEKELHRDRTWNPYDDTRIVYGDPQRKVKVVFVGIDVGTEDLVLISELNRQRREQKKKPIDLVMAHHPEGYALGGLSCVMDDIHVEVLRQAGVPVNITEKVLASRIREVGMSIASSNLHHTMDSARLLDLPLICCHTVADNAAYQVIKKVIEKVKPYRLRDIVDALMKVPAYQHAAKLFDKPVDIQVGSPDSRAGKVIIGGFTGGTDGNPEIIEYMVNVAGVGTTIDMHMSKKHLELAEKFRLNCVIASHMASDSIGMQPLVDMMRRHRIEVVTGSGYIDAP